MTFGDVGARIKEKRKENKLTQQQLAEAIGKTESSIRKYEKNLVEIPDAVMLKIADALNTTAEYLSGIERLNKQIKYKEAFNTLLEANGFKRSYGGYDEDSDIEYCEIEHKGIIYEINEEVMSNTEKNINSYIKFQMQELLK